MSILENGKVENLEQKSKREIDFSWDFATADTKEYTHCYHSYPAMMIPQVARRLIREYSNKKTELIFDPYCGSGTSLVEAKLAGINSIGTDINPLAELISRTKIQNFDLDIVAENRNQLVKHLNKFSPDSEKVSIPSFNNLEFWFKKEIVFQLGYIDWFIDHKIDKRVIDFFKVPFSETIREASYTRNSEFKLYRIAPEKIPSFNVKPLELFLKKIERNFNGLRLFNETINGNNIKGEVYDFNTCYGLPDKIELGSVDMIVTSPPYGDSHTVAYGQFSTLSNHWLDIPDARKIDSKLMGGKVKTNEELKIKSAQKELDEIKKIDYKRFLEVNAFLLDYKDSIKNVSKVVKRNGRACYVVGNRTVKKVNIPLDYITAEFFSEFGFKHEKTIVRNIPNKKMPSKNSPSNVAGDLVTTMNNEFVVIMKKE